MKKVYKIKNLDCANCARKLEEKLNKLSGVNECKVSFMMQKITLDIRDLNSDEVLDSVIKTCKKFEPDLIFLN